MNKLQADNLSAHRSVVGGRGQMFTLKLADLGVVTVFGIHTLVEGMFGLMIDEIY